MKSDSRMEWLPFRNKSGKSKADPQDSSSKSLNEALLSEIEERRKAEARCRYLFEDSKDMVFSTDAEGRIVDINKAGVELLSYASKYDIIGTNIKDYYYIPEDRDYFYKTITKKGYIKDFEVVLRRRNGEKVFGIESAVVIRDKTGGVAEYQGIIKDITNRIMTERVLAKTNFEFAEANKKLKEAQLQLIQRERLASIGHLAAGTAHEINNPLGFVKSNFKTVESYFDALLGYLAFLEKTVPADDARREEILRERTRLDIERILEDYRGLLDESRDGIERIITIVQNLKNFSRVDQQEAFHPFDLNKAVEAAIVIARNELKYVVKVELRLGDIPNPVCIGYEINQVLLNLILNAAQAVKSQGRKELGRLVVSTRLAGDCAECEISDDGPGIPDTIGDKIFEPFFTTKDSGTGLGLGISYDIVVKNHGGRLFYRNRTEGGASFFVQIPLKPANVRND